MLLTYELTYWHLGNVWLLQRKVLALFFVVFVFFIIVLICVIERVDPEKRATVVGSICVVIGSLMYSSPMTAIVSGFDF